MASVRQTSSGSWELTVRHKDLPKGRKFFTFDDEESATSYGQQWDAMVKAGLPIPAELLAPVRDETNLAKVIRHWMNGGHAAASDRVTLQQLLPEVGDVKIADVSYAWTERWLKHLKVQQNLAPSTIRKRVGSLSRALDAYIRSFPDIQGLGNPLKMLPKGYSSYNDKDATLVAAAGKQVKLDVSRDRRLNPGELPRIQEALAGVRRPDRERPLTDPSGAFAVLFYLILYTGLRLQEAFTLRRSNLMLDQRWLKSRTTKQWRGKIKHRTVPIRPELHMILTEYVNSADLADDLLFPYWDGTDQDLKRCSNRLSQRFKVLFDYAGLEDLTEHDLRHEATCMWLELKDAKGNWMFREQEIHRLMGWSPNSAMAVKYASFRGEDFASRLWASQ